MPNALAKEIEEIWNAGSEEDLLVPDDYKAGARATLEEASSFKRGGARRHYFPLGPEEVEAAYRESIRSQAKALVDGYRNRLARALCTDWRYCEKRAALRTDGAQLAIVVAVALISAGAGIPLPIASLSVYLVRNRLLDELCAC